MDDGWKIVIANDGVNFGFAQKLNTLRPTSPCCGEFLDAYCCRKCGKSHKNHPAHKVGDWVINTGVDLWPGSMPEAWISDLTGIPKEKFQVTITMT